MYSVCFDHHGGTDIGWAVGGDFSEGLILKTADGGTTWSAQTSGTNGAFLIRALCTKAADRLTVNPASGTISPGGSQTITVALNAQDLAEGSYQGQLSIRSNGGNRVVPVLIRVSTTTGVEENVAGLPLAFRLEQNYPNPFNPATMISFQLPVNSEVSLAIYNLNGQLVKRLASGKFASGRHEMLWDATDDRGLRVASGVYLSVLRAGDFVAQRKLVLMK